MIDLVTHDLYPAPVSDIIPNAGGRRLFDLMLKIFTGLATSMQRIFKLREVENTSQVPL
jgi:hypothetical protein